MTAVARRSAALCAAWMVTGFVHGVLNSDNMNVTGESFDYGPYRFLPECDPRFVAAYFDASGLYAYGRQPAAVGWNVERLAAAALAELQPAYAHALSACPRETRTPPSSAPCPPRLPAPPARGSVRRAVGAARGAAHTGGPSTRYDPCSSDGVSDRRS